MSFIKKQLERHISLLSEEDITSIQFIVKTEMMHREQLKKQKEAEELKRQEEIEFEMGRIHKASRTEYDSYMIYINE